MDGIEAARRIRGNEKRERRTPMFAVAAPVNDEDRGQSQLAGIDYLLKPIGLAPLLALLHRHL